MALEMGTYLLWAELRFREIKRLTGILDVGVRGFVVGFGVLVGKTVFVPVTNQSLRLERVLVHI
jgi:hypothetical protein